MRIAIIGSGISGLVCAHVLSRSHQVTVFEADDYAGGHTHTIMVPRREGNVSIDTGFIVYNERNYPQFTALLRQLGVATQPTTMSFSVSSARSGLEYNGRSLDTIFAQRLNLFRPSFLRMCSQILRFNKEATALATAVAPGLQTLGEFLDERRYGKEFREHYLYPMGAALWSAPPTAIAEIPALFFARFFHQHGMLTLGDRPEWRTVTNGSANYITLLRRGWRATLRLATPVASVKRSPGWVEVQPPTGEAERFDEVIFATHSDQALAALADASPAEVAILGAIPYQENDVVLHTDTSVLPRRKSLWAAWNYHIPAAAEQRATVSYHMNTLQRIPGATQFIVTLNDGGRIDPAKVIGRYTYGHPQFTAASVAAQARHGEISGFNRTHYCGAYWGNGFHEDGVVSALKVCHVFGWDLAGRAGTTPVKTKNAEDDEDV